MKAGMIALLLLVVTAVPEAQGQTQAQFQVPITITNGSNSDTLLLGVSGDGDGGTIQDNTIGVDYDPSFGAYQEPPAPPVPPPPFPFDVRFMTIPGRTQTFPTGLGTGVYKDFRGFTSYAQVDTFRIQVLGDDVDVRETVISWPSNLAVYGSAWIIRPQSGGEWQPVDMLGATSATMPTGALQRNVLIIKTGATTGVRQVDEEHPLEFSLAQNFPNPFNPSTEIRFSVPEAGRVTLTVHTVIGQQVATLVNGVVTAGNYSVRFSGDELASGLYFYRLQAGTTSAVRKMMLLK